MTGKFRTNYRECASNWRLALHCSMAFKEQQTWSTSFWVYLTPGTIILCFYFTGWELNLRKVSWRISIRCQLIQLDWKESKNASYKQDTRLLGLDIRPHTCITQHEPTIQSDQNYYQRTYFIKETIITSLYEFLMRSDSTRGSKVYYASIDCKTALINNKIHWKRIDDGYNVAVSLRVTWWCPLRSLI